MLSIGLESARLDSIWVKKATFAVMCHFVEQNDGSSDEIDDERAAQFLSRALAESQR